jgi:hypothetical protein
LVDETMRALGLREVIGRELKVRLRQRGYSEVEKTEATVLLMASGGECLDDIRVLQGDEGLSRLLGWKVPCSDSLRRYMYRFHDEALIKAAAEVAKERGEEAYIPEESEALKGLARVNVELVRRVARLGKCTKATVDYDATIQEAAKREALWHYKGGRGYQPAVAYWAEQDLVLVDEYRDGNVPAGMRNLPVIKRAFQALPEKVRDLYFRADSACYEGPVLKWLANCERADGPKGRISFTISADMSVQLREVCEGVADKEWEEVDDRAEETVACTDVEFTPGDWPKDSNPLRYVALRIRKKQGYLFGGGFDTKYLAVVSNRYEMKKAELIRWHWEKAGTIEHVHDVTKNELGAGVPPCGRFGANAAWYRHSLLTYNVLSAMKSLALGSELSAARPKRLRFLVFTLAGRLVMHAGRLLVRIGAEAERIAGLIAARTKLATLARAMASSG